MANNFIPKTSIVDNLTTDDATKVLSAKQGKTLKVDAIPWCRCLFGGMSNKIKTT